MMTNLVSERSPIKMLAGKRSLEYGTCGGHFLRGLKQPRVSAIRQFSPDCGPAASKFREACNEGVTLVKTSNESKTRPSKPLVQKLLGVSEKVELINEGNNDSLPKHTDTLCGSGTSSRRCLLSKTHPPPKLRKGVTIFRDFPRGCGTRNLDMSSKCDVLTDGKSIDVERRMFQTNEKIKNGGAKSRVERNGSDSEEFIRSDGFTGAIMAPPPVLNESIDVAHSDCRILPGTQPRIKTSDCIVATGAADGCGDQKRNINVNNGSHCLLLKHAETKTNFLDVEAGRSKALPYQKHNGALSLKQSDYLTINSHHEALSRTKSREVLDLFEQVLKKRLLEIKLKEKSTGKKNISNIYTEIAMVLRRQGKWIYMNQKLLGAIPGVEVGDQFRYRAELVVVGLHKQFSAGIDYMERDGKKIATSIVSSGRYSSDKEFLDVLIYSGQGGNQIMGEKNSKDQTLVRGNLALKNSMDEETPVRVIRGRRSCRNTTFTYDGLYFVSKFWQERAENGKLVYMFRLNRMQGQPKLKLRTLKKFGKPKARHFHALINDISSGKEKISIRVVNDIDNDKPPTFNYITRMVYPQTHGSLVETSGCHCINGCSDHGQCSCIIKNGCVVPFNENGALIEVKPTTIVHECGPLCKCPPSCKNRVSQHGIKFQLEIFKTEAKGWGVRSRNYISSGSFICEYVGELLNDKRAEERIGLDEYLFDIGDEDGFAIDAAKIGNIGRFVNHSCSPNLYAQNVLYDHNDKMMPHVMLFATQNIRPLQELTYNYNYKIGQVYDSNGNVKKKTCFCGAAMCGGRMY